MNKTISVLFATTIFTAPVLADQLRVVVDIPPVQGIVDSVLGSNARITTLIGSGIDPHNYTMKPSHAAAVSEADLIVLIGEALTPSLVGKLPSLANNAKIIKLAEVPNVHLIAYEDAHDEHQDDAHHDDEHHDYRYQVGNQRQERGNGGITDSLDVIGKSCDEIATFRLVMKTQR